MLLDLCYYRYCGHGSGADYLKRDSIQRLKCKATTLLMGCSSGKLKVYILCELLIISCIRPWYMIVRILCKINYFIFLLNNKVSDLLEASGMAVTYLQAGW